MTITASKIDTFVNAICDPGYQLTGESGAKALTFIDILPLSDEHLDSLSATGNKTLVDAVQRKRDQRRDDFVDTLFDAVDAGCDSLDEVASWLGVPAASSYSELLSQGHTYRRLGTPGRPETARLG